MLEHVLVRHSLIPELLHCTTSVLESGLPIQPQQQRGTHNRYGGQGHCQPGHIRRQCKLACRIEDPGCDRNRCLQGYFVISKERESRMLFTYEIVNESPEEIQPYAVVGFLGQVYGNDYVPQIILH